jgi:hypothetical protein
LIFVADFPLQDAPNYVPGLVAVMALFGLAVILSILTLFVLWRENKKADRDGKVIEGLAGFRYTL